MDDKDRNLQHAMMSFALWGGMLVGQRPPRRDERVVSHPSTFTPFRLDRKG